MSAARLVLIPNRISESPVDDFFTPAWKEEIRPLRHFLVEHPRSARQFLSALRLYDDIGSLHLEVLNVDTPLSDLPGLMKPLTEGHPMGVISESGCPGIADPGAYAVAFAHDHGIPVRPLVGPSSVVLALMASGMSGQRFSFNGYLPVQPQPLQEAIRKSERLSREQQSTQIFIESPHRNIRLLEALLQTLSPSTRLAIALDLTGKDERIISRRVSEWKKGAVPSLPKMPCIFLFQA